MFLDKFPCRLMPVPNGYITNEHWSAGGRTEAISSRAKMLAPEDKKTEASDTIISLLLEFSRCPELRRKMPLCYYMPVSIYTCYLER